MTAAIVSARLFPLLGVEPMLGRQIRSDEDRRGTAPVVLLGHALWLRRFGGDPKIVGRTITANGEPYEVIGVMPPGFSFPRPQRGQAARHPEPAALPGAHAAPLPGAGPARPGATLDAAPDGAGAGRRFDVAPVRQALLANAGENLRPGVSRC